MGVNGNGNGGYSMEVWDKIQAEWLAGQLSLSDISRTYGPTRSTIRAKAKRFNWPPRGSLVDQVRKEIRSQLLDVEGAPASAPPIHADEIIDNAAKRGVAVVRRQRNLLSQLLDIVGATLDELREMQFISREALEKKRTKHQAALVAALSKARLDGLRVVSGVLNKAIPLERQAFNLDKDDGGQLPIKYVAPRYKKPAGSGLSEDEWG